MRVTGRVRAIGAVAAIAAAAAGCAGSSSVDTPHFTAGEVERRYRPEFGTHAPAFLGFGHAQSWDGRLYFFGNLSGWSVKALRLENLQVDADGAPNFGDPALFSPAYKLESDGVGGLDQHLNLAVVPRPGVSPNPYRCDENGVARPDGDFERYDLVVFSSTWFVEPRFQLGRRDAFVILANPNTRLADVHSAALFGDQQPLRVAGSGATMRGIETTVTFDGRLLVFQDKVVESERNSTILMYSYNAAAPAQADGWTAPRPISEMYAAEQNTLIAGVPFARRYPIAAAPLRYADGTPVGAEMYRGAYPWITLDGTAIFHTTTVVGREDPAAAIRRGGYAVIGRGTAHATRYIDVDRINPDRDSKARLNFSALIEPGLWNPLHGLGRAGMPLTGAPQSFGIIGSDDGIYAELGFDDVSDGNYLVNLHMNEAIVRDQQPNPRPDDGRRPQGGIFDVLRTPDTSGNFATGRLEGGPAVGFRQEVGPLPGDARARDGNDGRIGQAIYFGQNGLVRAPYFPRLDQAAQALSVALYVKPLPGIATSQAAPLLLASQDGRWSIKLVDDLRVEALVVTPTEVRALTPPGPGLRPGEWNHVAMTYGAAGVLRVYVDGRLVAAQAFAAGALRLHDPPAPDLVIGPGRAPVAGAAPTPLLLIDEFSLSQVVRSDDEIARLGGGPRPAGDGEGAFYPGLPAGLQGSRIYFPGGRPRADQVALGRRLFFETRLSQTGDVSCASCHQPKLAFTDGKRRAVGVSGRELRFNTPTIVNRLLSTRQFFDGRAATLEEQALAPIADPDEMGSSVAAAVAFLQADASYRAEFLAALGGAPSAELLARALAAFERSLVSGDSRVDRYQAGELGALSASELRGRDLFFGKARCAACHGGPNYSDEQFHRTNLAAAPPAGRAAASGRDRDRGKLKTPSLRNLARTAPYLHDGSAADLRAVVDLYSRGGFSRLDQDDELFEINLAEAEKQDLIAFLLALEAPIVELDPESLVPAAAPPERAVLLDQTPEAEKAQRRQLIAGSMAALMPAGTTVSAATIDGIVERWGRNRYSAEQALEASYMAPEYTDALARAMFSEYTRSPSTVGAAGIAYWSARLQGGMDLRRFSPWILYGLPRSVFSCAPPPTACPTKEEFVPRAYELLLGRSPAAGERSYWEGRFTAVGLFNAVEEITASQEYQGHWTARYLGLLRGVPASQVEFHEMEVNYRHRGRADSLERIRKGISLCPRGQIYTRGGCYLPARKFFHPAAQNTAYFTTVNPSQLPDYQYAGIAGLLFASGGPGFRPLWTVWRAAASDHAFAISCTEIGDLLQRSIASPCEGVAIDDALHLGYLAVTPGPGLLPVYRLYNPSLDDVALAFGDAERDALLASYGYGPGDIVIGYAPVP